MFGVMPQIVINYWAILVSAIVMQVIGFVWYGPLFGKAWMRLMGFADADKEKMKKKASTGYFVMFVTSLIMIYVLKHFVIYAGAHDVAGGMKVAFWLWFGFIAPVQLGAVLWDGKPTKLFALNTLYHLISLLVVGAILVAWL